MQLIIIEVSLAVAFISFARCTTVPSLRNGRRWTAVFFVFTCMLGWKWADVITKEIAFGISSGTIPPTCVGLAGSLTCAGQYTMRTRFTLMALLIITGIISIVSTRVVRATNSASASRRVQQKRQITASNMTLASLPYSGSPQNRTTSTHSFCSVCVTATVSALRKTRRRP